jgi:hypothetical protein
LNLSVWESLGYLQEYVYRSAHVEVLRDRNEWFTKFERAYLALWWVPAGHRPSVDEAKKRLAYLDQHGPTPFAFTFKVAFPLVCIRAMPGDLDIVGTRLLVEAFVTAEYTSCTDGIPSFARRLRRLALGPKRSRVQDVDRVAHI